MTKIEVRLFSYRVTNDDGSMRDTAEIEQEMADDLTTLEGAIVQTYTFGVGLVIFAEYLVALKEEPKPDIAVVQPGQIRIVK